MSIRNKYENELSHVFNKLVEMCHATELAIEKSINALKQRDDGLAREVMSEDKNIDHLERDIEQDCLKILDGAPGGKRFPRSFRRAQDDHRSREDRRSGLRIFPNFPCNSKGKSLSKNRFISK